MGRQALIEVDAGDTRSEQRIENDDVEEEKNEAHDDQMEDVEEEGEEKQELEKEEEEDEDEDEDEEEEEGEKEEEENEGEDGEEIEEEKEETENEDEEEDTEDEELSIPHCLKSINIKEYRIEIVSDNVPYFPARVNVRSSWKNFNKIKDVLTKFKGVDAFRESCFGHFMDLGDKWKKGFWGQATHYLLLHSVKCNKKSEMWFVVDRKPLRFGMKEYCLITGLNCGPFPEAKEEEKIKKSTKAKKFLERVL